MDVKKMSEAIAEVVEEYEKAAQHFPPFASDHEGWAIILEEVEELWAEVQKWSKRERDYHQTMTRHEAKQVAAMALRFMVDRT